MKIRERVEGVVELGAIYTGAIVFSAVDKFVRLHGELEPAWGRLQWRIIKRFLRRPK